LNRRPRTIDYGMRALYRTIDTILLGRKTYDLAIDYCKRTGKKSGIFDTSLANYVFSSKPSKEKLPGVEFVSEPVKEFAQRLRSTPGKHIWMMGGGELIASFLDVGELDEFDIHTIPTFIGEGIPLVAPGTATWRCACAQLGNTPTASSECAARFPANPETSQPWPVATIPPRHEHERSEPTPDPPACRPIPLALRRPWIA
jgi:dihydrofolate reductase